MRMIGWEAALRKAMKSSRGQAFLVELRNALDALPEKILVANAFEQDGAYCALGTVARLRGVSIPAYDPDEDSYGISEETAAALKMAKTLAAEIMEVNDNGSRHDETPEQRWLRVRKWVARRIPEWEWPKSRRD